MNAIAKDIAAQKRRSVISTAASLAADTIVFALLIKVAPIRRRALRLIASAAVAEVISSALCYMLHSKYVFRRSDGRSLARYCILSTMRLCFSCGTVGILAGIHGMPAVPVRLAGSAILRLGNYRMMSIAVFNPSDSSGRFYGCFARNAQTILRLLSRRYSCDIQPDDEPVVYVCRHLNMHGPYTTLKWLPFDVHPLMLAPFFDTKTGYEHMREYTFARRWGRKPLRFSLAAWISSRAAYLAASSLRGVPTYRNSANAITTLKTGLRYLRQGESLIVFPDIDYTGSYDAESDIYSGFLYYGEMYHKATGKSLRFVPLWIDEENRAIISGTPVEVSSRKDSEAAAEHIKAAINGQNNFAA